MSANKRLDFYYIESDYLHFLRDKYKGDIHVPYVDYVTNDKFFIGIVLQIGNHKYFAPVSSNKRTTFSSFNIKRGKKTISSIRLNYMFPVVDGVYSKIDFNDIQDKQYRNLLTK